MPNRIIKESICTSVNFNKLSVYGERHFYRLLTQTDDWGCFEATADVVRGHCYPKQLNKVTEALIGKWQQELFEKEIAGYWADGGKVFGKFLAFDLHNKYAIDCEGRKTRHRRKTPIEPQQLMGFYETLGAAVSGGEQLGAKVANPNLNPNLNLNKEREELYVKRGKSFPTLDPNFKDPEIAKVEKEYEEKEETDFSNKKSKEPDISEAEFLRRAKQPNPYGIMPTQRGEDDEDGIQTLEEYANNKPDRT